eukprot:CAMPEP_0197315932 /NCGR_PEP_ID=MMETSP0891-20130614/39893_1 /TAXON_ID=44058 ORGANISM="Aureoumbra lagunensis, Strain CCMP1510" /NCGR_SAMPLE_ID=MMETSP0891 /ASSEMBLY_ACC=CAM_ASM_000534 /LENGTH=611 /DNA_ID=CAMNT_0042805123 /DNA_START=111 /DNA_END=1946 /DNA_ORIENTATION=+
MERFVSRNGELESIHPNKKDDEAPPPKLPEDLDEDGDFDDAPLPAKIDSIMEEDGDARAEENNKTILWDEELDDDDDDSDFAPSLENGDELWCDAEEKKALNQLEISPPPFVDSEPIESYRYPSNSQTFVGEMALLIDEHGRCKLGGGVRPDLNFNTQVWENAVSVTDALIKDAVQVFESSIEARSQGQSYSNGSTFWVPANAERSRLCGLERLALDIFDRHTKAYSRQHLHGETNDASEIDQIGGAEWWTLAIDPDQGQVGWHWDRDYSLEDEDQGCVNMPPHLSTVTYLSDAGASTVVTELWPPRAAKQQFSKLGNSCAVIEPRVGKHLKFDGRFLHAAIDLHDTLNSDIDDADTTSESISSFMHPANQNKRKEPNKRKRITFLVNIWLEWHPSDAQPLPDKVKTQLILQPPASNDIVQHNNIDKKRHKHKVKVHFTATPSNYEYLGLDDSSNDGKKEEPHHGLTDILLQPQDLKLVQPLAWNFDIPYHRARVALALNKEWFGRSSSLANDDDKSSSFLFRIDTSKPVFRPLCAVATISNSSDDDGENNDYAGSHRQSLLFSEKTKPPLKEAVAVNGHTTSPPSSQQQQQKKRKKKKKKTEKSALDKKN